MYTVQKHSVIRMELSWRNIWDSSQFLNDDFWFKDLTVLPTCEKLTLYLRVHGHSGQFGVDVSAGCCCRVTGEGLRWGHLVPPAEFQRTAAVHLFDLRQVWLRRYHHTRSLAVHEVLLLAQRHGDEQRRVSKLKVNVCLLTAWDKRAACYLKDFGAVFKGVRVADVIDQTDNIAGQVSIRQVVKVREHFMKLSGQKNMDYCKFKMLSEAKKKIIWLSDWHCTVENIRISPWTPVLRGESVLKYKQVAT